MATTQELHQRWLAFLEKIETRYTESLQQAEEACLEQLVATDYDYYTVFRAWMGMKAQIEQIITKIDSTWNEKVKPQFEAITPQETLFRAQTDLSHDLKERLNANIYRFGIELQGKLSQAYYKHTITIAQQAHNCSQCGAPIRLKGDLFRAQYITCQACTSVNTIVPERKYLQIGGNILDNIVTYQLLPLHDEMLETLEKLKNVRKSEQTAEQWESYKTSYFNYWERFFKERIALKSNEAERYEDDIKRKTKEFENYRKIHQSKA